MIVLIINLNNIIMMRLNFLIIAVTTAMIFGLVYANRNYILGVAWKIFFKYVSDEKLEKIVRQEYEFYNRNRRAYTEDGLCWLIDMAYHLCSVWKIKIAALQKTYSAGATEDIKLSVQKQSHILSYWQDALQQLMYEVNRRKYFMS